MGRVTQTTEVAIWSPPKHPLSNAGEEHGYCGGLDDADDLCSRSAQNSLKRKEGSRLSRNPHSSSEQLNPLCMCTLRTDSFTCPEL